MKVVVQKTLKSSVSVDGKVINKIDSGLMLLVGINVEDTSYKGDDDSYLVDVTWSYDSNYNASNHANITLVKDNNKLIIVKVETIDENTD